MVKLIIVMAAVIAAGMLSSRAFRRYQESQEKTDKNKFIAATALDVVLMILAVIFFKTYS